MDRSNDTQHGGDDLARGRDRGDEDRSERRDDDDRGAQGDAIKDPDDWTTGDEPMTGPQASYLSTLARQAHEPAPEDLTKAEASKKIDELQEKTGRGKGG